MAVQSHSAWLIVLCVLHYTAQQSASEVCAAVIPNLQTASTLYAAVAPTASIHAAAAMSNLQIARAECAAMAPIQQTVPRVVSVSPQNLGTFLSDVLGPNLATAKMYRFNLSSLLTTAYHRYHNTVNLDSSKPFVSISSKTRGRGLTGGSSHMILGFPGRIAVNNKDHALLSNGVQSQSNSFADFQTELDRPEHRINRDSTQTNGGSASEFIDNFKDSDIITDFHAESSETIPVSVSSVEEPGTITTDESSAEETKLIPAAVISDKESETKPADESSVAETVPVTVSRTDKTNLMPAAVSNATETMPAAVGSYDETMPTAVSSATETMPTAVRSDEETMAAAVGSAEETIPAAIRSAEEAKLMSTAVSSAEETETMPTAVSSAEETKLMAAAVSSAEESIPVAVSIAEETKLMSAVVSSVDETMAAAVSSAKESETVPADERRAEEYETMSITVSSTGQNSKNDVSSSLLFKNFGTDSFDKKKFDAVLDDYSGLDGKGPITPESYSISKHPNEANELSSHKPSNLSGEKTTGVIYAIPSKEHTAFSITDKKDYTAQTYNSKERQVPSKFIKYTKGEDFSSDSDDSLSLSSENNSKPILIFDGNLSDVNGFVLETVGNLDHGTVDETVVFMSNTTNFTSAPDNISDPDLSNRSLSYGETVITFNESRANLPRNLSEDIKVGSVYPEKKKYQVRGKVNLDPEVTKHSHLRITSTGHEKAARKLKKAKRLQNTRTVPKVNTRKQANATEKFDAKPLQNTRTVPEIKIRKVENTVGKFGTNRSQNTKTLPEINTRKLENVSEKFDPKPLQNTRTVQEINARKLDNATWKFGTNRSQNTKTLPDLNTGKLENATVRFDAKRLENTKTVLEINTRKQENVTKIFDAKHLEYTRTVPEINTRKVENTIGKFDTNHTQNASIVVKHITRKLKNATDKFDGKAQFLIADNINVGVSNNISKITPPSADGNSSSSPIPTRPLFNESQSTKVNKTINTSLGLDSDNILTEIKNIVSGGAKMTEFENDYDQQIDIFKGILDAVNDQSDFNSSFKEYKSLLNNIINITDSERSEKTNSSLELTDFLESVVNKSENNEMLVNNLLESIRNNYNHQPIPGSVSYGLLVKTWKVTLIKLISDLLQTTVDQRL